MATEERKPESDADTYCRDRLQEMVNADGVSKTARALRMHRETILAVIAGVSVRDGTLALLRERMNANEHAHALR